MSLVTFKVLWCDAPDCQDEFGMEPDAASLRKFARRAGWSRHDGKDFCPEHSEPAS